MTSGTDGWVRAPRQARSAETLTRFVDATRRLLTQRPFEEITVADIVSEADRTVGSFYARFEDKEAVLFVLVDELHQRLRELTRAFCDPVRWEEASLADFVAESVRLNVAAYRRAGPLFRAALTACATDARFRDRRAETMQICAEHQKTFIVSRADELRAPDPARASDLMFETVVATLDQELLFGRFTTTGPLSDVDLEQELTERCLMLLGVTSTPRIDSST